MPIEQSLKGHVQQLLDAAGLPISGIIHESIHPEHFGDSEVAFEVGPMHLRFIRERGQDFVEVSPACAPNNFHQYGDVELAMGWKNVDQVWSRSEPETLTSIIERLRAHWPEVAHAFSREKANETLLKLDFASRRRGGAFVNHLRRVAEDARTK